MAFKNFEEYQEYLRQQLASGNVQTTSKTAKAASAPKSATAKHQSTVVEATKASYKLVDKVDEFGVTHTEYVRVKSTAEKLQEQLEKERRRAGDMRVTYIPTDLSIIVPKDFFDIFGNLKPSKVTEYEAMMAMIRLEDAAPVKVETEETQLMREIQEYILKAAATK